MLRITAKQSGDHRACVYAIVNEVNGRIYVGSTNDFSARMRQHAEAFKSDYQSRSMQADWNDGHSFSCFILSPVHGVHALRLMETFWILNLRDNGHYLYNVAMIIPIPAFDRETTPCTAYRQLMRIASKAGSSDADFLKNLERINNMLAYLYRGEWRNAVYRV